MDNVLFIDIGSTFTKVCAVDMDSITLLGRAQAPTTVSTDVRRGLDEAVSKLSMSIGTDVFADRLACSSAAGGLAVAVSGLVESLTLKAARTAALGAGARIVKGFHHKLTKSDLNFLNDNHFDIFLLTGGTDGGNTETILENARLIAGLSGVFPIVVAGNRNAADEAADILREAGKEVHVCPNILPDLERMNTEPVNKVMRSIFMDRIIHAKGMAAVDEMASNDIIPTPYSVLEASGLLADGYEGEAGLGCLLTVDAGGATTDVHSVCVGYGTRGDVLYEGLKEPRVMRTVEGDIGVRWNLSTIVDMLPKRRDEYLSFLRQAGVDPAVLFGEEGAEFEETVARKAIETAVIRHCGTLNRQFTPRGVRYIQRGKDLTEASALVATGGPVASAANPERILGGAFYDGTLPESLRPKEPDIYIDSEYIMASAGLMSLISREKALGFMKRYIKKYEKRYGHA